MKCGRCIASLLIVGLLSGTCLAQTDSPGELRFSGMYIAPGDSETWDKSFGGEVQAVFWTSSEVGIAPSIGFEKWRAQEIYLGAYFPTEGILIAANAKGSATAIPIGLSLIVRPQMPGSVGFLFEGGVRYIKMNSDVVLTVLVDDGDDRIVLREKLTIDGGFTGRIYGALNFAADPKASAFIGAGYQFDLSQDNTPFKGFFVKAGLGFGF